MTAKLGGLSHDELEDRIKKQMEKLEPDGSDYDEGYWDALYWILNLVRLPD